MQEIFLWNSFDQRRVQALYNPTTADSFPATVEAHFKQLFSSDDAFMEIPALDIARPPESHKPNSLIRFRGMVQDTSLPPEMYLAVLSDGRCGGWGIEEHEHLFDYSNIKECSVIWAVSIPGESPWLTPGNANASISHLPSNPQKFNNPNTPHVGVQIKFYDTSRADSMKSTGIHDFVGILSSEPWHSNLEAEETILVPTLHVVFSRPLPSTIIPRSYPSSPLHSSVSEVRDELIAWIAGEALAGDRDAADQSRSPPIFPLTLTLSHFPACSPGSPSTTPTLLAVLSLIFPLVSTLPLSLETINTSSFAPESKEEDLHGGWLQLPQGSICVITECGLTEGEINERGIMNLRAVQEMISNQNLEYVFPFSRYAFQADAVFIVVCEGSKSAFFQTSINIPVRVASDDISSIYKSQNEIRLPSPEMLEAFRALVGGSRIGNVAVSEESAQYIQDDFIRQRKEGTRSGKQTITSDDLIYQMMMARLLALSLHETDVTTGIWEKVRVLDSRRRERLN